jgi:hypothetical protein
VQPDEEILTEPVTPEESEPTPEELVVWTRDAKELAKTIETQMALGTRPAAVVITACGYLLASGLLAMAADRAHLVESVEFFCDTLRQLTIEQFDRLMQRMVASDLPTA